MKKSFIPILVFLISFSLVGLIAIQIYWIQNSIALRDAQFDRNVKMAMLEVNNAMERIEARERMKKNGLLHRLDSIRQMSFQGSIPLQTRSHRKDSSLYVSDDGSFTLRFSQEQTTGTFNNPFFEDVSPSDQADESPDVAYFSERETKIIAELLSGILNIDLGSNFLDRYDSRQVDSLLNRSLHDFGSIETDYVFGIFDAFNGTEMLSDGADNLMYELLNSEYKIRLFPNDFSQPPKYLNLWFPNRETYLIKTLWPLLTSSALFMIVIVMAFVYSIRTILRQKKISEIKNDFINNMTHELKTPISTISLACEALSDNSIQSSTNRMDNYVGMIRDENKRLGVLVENVLRSAVLDRSEMEFSKDEVNLHEVIQTAVRNISLQIERNNGLIQMDLNAVDPVVYGDEIHLTNVVYNLLDNAVKYSKENPRITISTTDSAGGIDLAVTDKGIGIKKDQQNRIFDKLYRVPTGDIHDIKGFGLGLSYVKSVVEKHGGSAKVESDFGKGSKFTLHLPNNHNP